MSEFFVCASGQAPATVYQIRKTFSAMISAGPDPRRDGGGPDLHVPRGRTYVDLGLNQA